MKQKEKLKALAYYRTSSASNVSRKNGNGDKDSERRQRLAVQAYAKRANMEIVGEYYDAAVSGARDLTVQETGFQQLKKLGKAFTHVNAIGGRQPGQLSIR